MMIFSILAAAAVTNAVVLTADFDQEVGRVRPELHNSGFAPQICSCSQKTIDQIKAMGFTYARTHDWALTNPNQRVCDWHFIFPLPEKDAKDPSNYYFDATDYLLTRAREEAGQKIFFRLGTSIEHSGDVHHFNANVPKDFDQVAEVFAATVRHYNRGWAKGHEWDVKYWEIWNEPDGLVTMWFDPVLSKGGNNGPHKKEMRDRFAVLFAKCVKRLKDEFGDTIKVGGPALTTYNPDYFKALKRECDKLGVKPDFISWHHYVENPDQITGAANNARVFCDQVGWKNCELIINEWHYFAYSEYSWGNFSTSPKAKKGPRAHNGIDSSCFNLAVLARLQYSKLDQAYYYGCRHTGSWGFKDGDTLYPVYYGLCLFGDFVHSGCDVLCKVGNFDVDKAPIVAAVAAKSADGRKRALLVSDYRVRTKEVVVNVRGVPAGAKVRAEIHDYTRSRAKADFIFRDGVLTLAKPDAESAAWLITFE